MAESVITEAWPLLNADRPTRTVLAWHPASAAEVAVSFQDRDQWRDWVFPRELLATGLHYQTTAGDVRAQPFPDIPGVVSDLLLTVSNPEGDIPPALFLFPGVVIARFLTATYRQVMRGAEHPAAPEDAPGGEGRG